MSYYVMDCERHSKVLPLESERTSSDSLAMRMAIRLAAAMISLSLDDHSRTALCKLCAATCVLTMLLVIIINDLKMFYWSAYDYTMWWWCFFIVLLDWTRLYCNHNKLISMIIMSKDTMRYQNIPNIFKFTNEVIFLILFFFNYLLSCYLRRILLGNDDLLELKRKIHLKEPFPA